MLAFSCNNCGQLVFFENTGCLHCGAPLGVVPFLGVVAFEQEPTEGTYRIIGDTGGRRFARCANADRLTCNWMVDAEEAGAQCRSCRLTRTLPNDDDPAAVEPLMVAEEAKRRLVYQLDVLGLPVVDRTQDPEFGLAFDLLSSRDVPVTTGHADGVITIDLAESDDVHRAGVAQAMGEAYRTMLGHMRHEIGHYYWQVFARDPEVLGRIRDVFGDDTIDYAEALQRHYGDDGPPPGWEDRYVSAYATTHPWEDWAETFAHYLHIRGTLQTAAAYGVVVTGPAAVSGSDGELLSSFPRDESLERLPFDDILADWLPLTYALNELNRAMGRPALYPFVLAPQVVAKLDLVHRLVAHGSNP
jgi:hypothetical protein